MKTNQKKQSGGKHKSKEKRNKEGGARKDQLEKNKLNQKGTAFRKR